MHPASQPFSAPASYGQLSGSQIRPSRATRSIPTTRQCRATTLLAGQSLTEQTRYSPNHGMLASPDQSATPSRLNKGQAVVMAWTPDGSSHPIWWTDNKNLYEDGSSLYC